MRAREVLRFDHAKHRTETKTDCVRCHADAGSGAAILRPKMAECLSCHGHDDEFMAKDCQACHVDLQTEGTVPEDHFVHSPTFGSDHASVAAHADSMCATCHSERTCAACHAGDMMPAAPERLAFDTPGMGGLHAAGFLARHADESERGRTVHVVPRPRELLELSRARAAPVQEGRRRDPPIAPRRLDRPTQAPNLQGPRCGGTPRAAESLPWRRWGASWRQAATRSAPPGATRTRRARVRAATSRPGRASLATSEAAEVAARGASSAGLLHLAPLLAAVAIATACGLMGGGDDAEEAAPPPKDPHAGLDAKAAHRGDAKRRTRAAARAAARLATT
ncbi:MAG: cytochrome c3 family protein [Polyangiaceae bacterium]|nr:cytochrome c3 family protein [Polyangiaceae bacterium]